MERRVRTAVDQSQVGVPEDDCEHVVEVVRNTAGEASDRLQLLCLRKLRAELLAHRFGAAGLGHVPQDVYEPGHLAGLRVAERERSRLAGEDLAVLPCEVALAVPTPGGRILPGVPHGSLEAGGLGVETRAAPSEQVAAAVSEQLHERGVVVGDAVLGVEHENRVALAVEERAVALFSFLEGVRGLPLLRAVAEHQHDAQDVPLVVEDGCAAVRDRALRPVPRDEERVVGQSHDLLLAEGPFDRALHRQAGMLLDDREDLAHGPADGLGPAPPREVLRHLVDDLDPSLPVGGDDAVTDALERQPMPSFTRLLPRFGAGERPVVPALTLLPCDTRPRGQHEEERRDQAHDPSEPRLERREELLALPRGHEEPGRVRDGPQCREHRHPTIVESLDDTLASAHGHHRRAHAVGQGEAQSERRAVPKAQIHEREHPLSVPPDEIRHRRADARLGPTTDEREEVRLGIDRQVDDGEATPGVSGSITGASRPMRSAPSPGLRCRAPNDTSPDAAASDTSRV